VKDSNSLRNEVSEMMPGSEAKVSILRGGSEQTVGVRLGERQASAEESTDRREPGASSGFGLSVEPLTREIARQLGVSSTSGLVVTGVEPSSRAADAGLEEGDVIEEVNGAKVTTGEGLKSALNASTGKPALLLVHRGDVTVYVPLAR
jgi:serine protease Do